MTRLWASLSGTALCAIAVACSPTAVCGRSVPEPQALVEGTVRTQAGAPIPGVAIATRSLPPDCIAVNESSPDPQTTSATDGTYHLRIPGPGGPEACAEITAVRTVGTVADTVVTELVVVVGIPTPPAVTLDIVFPS